MLAGSDPDKRPDDPRADVKAVANTLLLRSEIGTEALAECRSAILRTTDIDGALGGDCKNDCFHSEPGDIQRRRPAWRSRNRETSILSRSLGGAPSLVVPTF